MYRFLIFFLFIGATIRNVSAQGTVSGIVLEAKTGKSISRASVQLMRMGDSAKQYAMAADKDGNFSFSKLGLGYYRLTIQSIGFSKLQIDSIVLRADRTDINLGEMMMHELSSSLNEVIVYAEKPLIENRDGKISYNVSESPLGNGSNASELLKNMPLVNVNSDGTILLRGKEPLILMDEKPTNLNAQQLTELLESLPANVIEKVEIMVNPPPEYATYPGGVINIVTKKGRVGIYGRLSASAGSRGESSVSSNFSYRSAQLNVNANAGVGWLEARGNSYSHRQNIYKDSVNYFYSQSSYVNRSTMPNMRLQTDYDPDKQNSLSFVYQGYMNYSDNSNTTFYTNLDSLLHVYKASSRSNHYDGSGYSHGIYGSYQWKGKNPVEKLQLYTGYNLGKNENNRDFYQQFLQPDFLPTGIDSTQSQFFDTYTTSWYAKLNYNKPLNDTGTTFLTSGVAYSSNSFHNVLNTDFLRKSDNQYIRNDLLSNNFYFDQDILTVRAGLVVSLPMRWRLITGVQAEHSNTTFHFIKGNASDANNGYWRLLPNATLRKDITRELNMALVFRETIRRPGMVELNPSIDYSDPYNIRFGNPYLQPSLIDNFDLNIGYNQRKFNINASLGYNRIKNVFNSIRTLVDSGKTQISYQNISDQNEYIASLWTGITLSQSLRVNISSGYNYNQYDARMKQLYRYNDGGSFYSGLNFSYTPDKLTVIEGSTRYSSFASPQGRSRTNMSMSFGVQRKFFNRKLIVGLAAIDPLGLLQYNGYTYAPNFIIQSQSRSNTRNFRITVSYQLNKTIIKRKLSEEKQKEALEKVQHKS